CGAAAAVRDRREGHRGARRRRQDRQARRRVRAAHADRRDEDGQGSDVVAAIVLAAGEAARVGSPEQRGFLPAVLAALEQSSVEEVVVVTGAYDVETEARVVHCPEWKRGPGASLRCGLCDVDAEAALVVLADGPELDARAVDRVVEAWREGAGD